MCLGYGHATSPFDYACWGYDHGNAAATPEPVAVNDDGAEGNGTCEHSSGRTERVVSRKAKGKAGASKPKGSNFCPDEDHIVVKSWFEISCDPITNTGQRREKFWDRVWRQYNSKRGRYVERSARSLQSRWESIKAEVMKFSSFYDEVLRSNHSGFSDADKVLLLQVHI
jgi:hypothetical protein